MELENEKPTVNIMVEYPDAIDFFPEGTVFKVTCLAGNEIITNEYSGIFVGSLIRAKINELFNLLNIIDNYGFLEITDE